MLIPSSDLNHQSDGCGPKPKYPIYPYLTSNHLLDFTGWFRLTHNHILSGSWMIDDGWSSIVGPTCSLGRLPITWTHLLVSILLLVVDLQEVDTNGQPRSFIHPLSTFHTEGGAPRKKPSATETLHRLFRPPTEHHRMLDEPIRISIDMLQNESFPI